MTEGGAGAGGMGRQQEGRGQRNVHKHMQHGAMQQGCARAGSCHTAMRKRKAEVHNTSSRTGHATTLTEGARIFCRFISLFMNYTPRGHTVDTQHYAAMRETERYRKRTRPAPRNKRTM